VSRFKDKEEHDRHCLYCKLVDFIAEHAANYQAATGEKYSDTQVADDLIHLACGMMLQERDISSLGDATAMLFMDVAESVRIIMDRKAKKAIIEKILGSSDLPEGVKATVLKMNMSTGEMEAIEGEEADQLLKAFLESEEGKKAGLTMEDLKHEAEISGEYAHHWKKTAGHG
jgi:hypothetical protein